MTTQPTNPAPLAPREGGLPATIDLGPAMQAAAALGREGVEVLERLHAIQQGMAVAQAKRLFLEAFALARAEFPKIEKRSQGPHTTRVGTKTKGNYAPLDEIAAAVDPVLYRHGFTYTWDRETADGKEWCVFILRHAAGHETRSRFPAMVDEGRGRTALQSVASGESYAKRYSMIAGLGITTADPDDDGANAGKTPGPPITPEQAANLRAVLSEIKASEQRFCSYYEIERLEDLPAARWQDALAAIEARRKEKR